MKKFISIILTLVLVVTSICVFGTASTSAKGIYDYDDYKGFKYKVRPDGNSICVYGYNVDLDKDGPGYKDGLVKIPERIKGKKVLVINALGTFADSGTEKLFIPRYVKKIGRTYLDPECRNTKIAVSKYNKKYCSSKGMLMSKSKKTLYWTPELYSNKAKTKVKIPNTVVNIGKEAFGVYDRHPLYHPSITFILPKGLKEIRERAFSGIETLEIITLPDGLKVIDDYALSVTGINKIRVPKSVKKIGKKAFGYDMYLRKRKTFVVEGYKGSAAEKYAKEKGFKFKAL